LGYFIIMNIPYKKQYSNLGILLNPITKENPYLNAPNIALNKLFERKKAIKLRYWERTRNKFFLGNTITT